MKMSERKYEGKAAVILEIAQKRFGLYGIEKTTMKEIADDLNMTKGSLYYYFPDKENLYKAVVDKEQQEFIKVVHDDLKNTSDPEEGIKKYVLNRISYFRTMINLSRLRAETYSEFKPLIADSIVKFREKEKKIIVTLLERGISEGIFYIDDPAGTAILFLDLLKGLRSAVLDDKKQFIINDEEFRIMSEKIMMFTSIFINGLKNKRNK